MSLIYAFDLHQTLDKYEKCRLFVKKLKSEGHYVYIMSGSPTYEIKNECLKFGFTLGIDYDKILSIIDYAQYELKIPCWQEQSPRTGKLSWYCNDDVWWAIKSILCNKYNINFIIDDKIQYLKYFGENHPTKFILYDDSFDKKLTI